MIEYKSESCFEQFENKVSEVRDDGCAIKGETMKLLGDVAYGSTLTNKAKHVTVAYGLSDKISKLVNKLRFGETVRGRP